MYRLAPGNVLQLMEIKRRLSRFRGKRFVEVGAGNGYVSHALLSLGMSGVGVDLNESACANNEASNAQAIRERRYRVVRGDFFEAPLDPTDVVISSMVVEHLPPPRLDTYFERARSLLAPGGTIVTLVPGSPDHWGIEDEIAGHEKRYTRVCFDEIAARHALRVVHTVGLTYPLSNWLLPLSNFLVRRAEHKKLGLSADERTVQSGNRDVAFKTTFPPLTVLLVNELTMLPFDLLQRAFRNNSRAMILYAELAT